MTTTGTNGVRANAQQGERLMTEMDLDGTGADPSPTATGSARSVNVAGHQLSWRQVGAAVCLLLGGVLIATGWVGVSQNNEVWQQMPYFVSGGVGGLALVLVGLGLYNAHQHAVDQAQVGELCRRLQALELGLGGEFDDVLGRLDELAVGRARMRS
jgi:hypothetical protein